MIRDKHNKSFRFDTAPESAIWRTMKKSTRVVPSITKINLGAPQA